MITLFNQHASSARYYRSSGFSTPCACRTPEGFRDPELHLSFQKYGPQANFTVEPGPIPVGTFLAYEFIASKNGVRMSPAIAFPPAGQSVVSDVDFQVSIPMLWPEGFDMFLIYRSENGGPYLFLDSMAPTLTTFVDDYPLGSGNAGLPFESPVMCNEVGEIPQGPVDIIVKAFVQPIQSTRATRLSTEYLQEVFGNIEADDHLGIFPVNWAGQRLDFQNWGQHGEDFIDYNGQRFFVINANMIPDPGDGNPEHHWELGLRMLRSDGLLV